MYTAASTPSGSYAVSDSNGQQVATGSADILGNYGLSETNLGTPKTAAAPTTPASSPSLIVTSGSSRTAVNSSVNNLNTALSGISTPATTNTAPAGSPLQPNNPQAGATYGTGAESGALIATPSSTQSLRINGGTYTGQDGNLYYKYDGTAADNSPAPSGSNGGSNTPGTTTTNDDGSSSITLNDGTSVSIPAGTDPGLASEYTSAVNNANSILAERQNDLTAAQATVQNDPAATAALQTISDQYNVLIQQMQAKNSQVLGKASSAVGAFGGLGQMSQNFMSDEMDAANTRVANLVAQEQDLLMKTSIAYKTGDLKALSAAEDAYQQANTAKLTAINDLLTATNKQVAANQAQQKIDAATAKAQNTQDLSNSVKGAAGALTLASTNFGVTDPSKLSSDQLNQLAAAYGVSNPAILLSQMTTAYATQQKATLTASNTQSEIDTRQQNANTSASRAATAAAKTQAGPKLTAAQSTANEVTGINKLLTMKDENGTPYIDQDSLTAGSNGSKGYFTVAGFNTLVTNTSLPRATFIKQYASYFSPDNLGNYGLTPAEQATIENTGKTPAATN